MNKLKFVFGEIFLQIYICNFLGGGRPSKAFIVDIDIHICPCCPFGQEFDILVTLHYKKQT